ncbi:FtsW/RodA/SpoVE family cell cycle protein [Rothia sp. AR01]|uniref:peptidoglycan glycosyltransferase n=1 Tax=Rothia santali TaxID=2949643 RepID=A0A9X2HF09_9MICC|nr:FtsW/RodA/SpoVE family cell cycle protein [Rothia santali]MCP3426890.1 FtsW/RodA/SpoVE family cell cycle protein [Rothia santali]
MTPTTRDHSTRPAAESEHSPQASPEPAQVPRSRRLIELFLLVIAWVIGIGAMCMVDVELAAELDSRIVMAGASLIVGSLIIHVILHLKARYADPFILPAAVALNGVGLAMIYRIDLTTNNAVAPSQTAWTAVAMIACAACVWFLKDHRVLRRITYISLAASILLLLLPLTPGLGTEINGARIWISLGGRTFQPGEVAKITLAVFFAGYLSANRDLILLAGKRIGRIRLPRFRDFAPMFVAWLVSIGVLVLQRDLGSAILFFGLFLAMIYLATNNLTWVVIGLLLVVVGGVFAYSTMSHVTLRIDSWLGAFEPEVYNQEFGGSGQIVQGLFGLASGGLFGRGLGAGRPDLVAFSNSDMIITSLGEELGLLGLGALLMLFLVLISRGLRAALGTPDAFGKLLGAGLSAVLVLQLFVVVGGVTRLIPLTGLTTPFMSAGGSSLLANWVIVGLLLAISHSARSPRVVGDEEPEEGSGTGHAPTPSSLPATDDPGATAAISRLGSTRREAPSRRGAPEAPDASDTSPTSAGGRP